MKQKYLRFLNMKRFKKVYKTQFPHNVELKGDRSHTEALLFIDTGVLQLRTVGEKGY